MSNLKMINDNFINYPKSTIYNNNIRNMNSQSSTLLSHPLIYKNTDTCSRTNVLKSTFNDSSVTLFGNNGQLLPKQGNINQYATLQGNNCQYYPANLNVSVYKNKYGAYIKTKFGKVYL
tara:strand:- start:714 stop:1070 length:357 start_codon:yes stop_codon:yes gene_type:complete